MLRVDQSEGALNKKTMFLRLILPRERQACACMRAYMLSPLPTAWHAEKEWIEIAIADLRQIGTLRFVPIL